MKNTRLHANENWYNPLPDIKEDLLKRLLNIKLQEYPDSDAVKLKEAIKDYIGVPQDQLICTNGSDELIKIIFDAFSKPGDNIVIHSPTFIEYSVMSNIRGCNLCSVDPKSNLLADVDEIINEAVRTNAAITFICTPNNPTGHVFSPTDLMRIIEEVPGLVVVDEAYAEFSQMSLIDTSYDTDKVIVMRTLSKAFGAAAIRVGYGVASPQRIKAMNKVKMPYNLSAFAQESAIVLLENRHLLENVLRNIRQERMSVYGRLKEIEETTGALEVFPSYGNYILIRSSADKDIYDALTANGLKIRKFEHDKNLKQCLRFSITQKQTNTSVVEIIRRVVSTTYE
ncbi:histidinol-phosphate transaminase [Fusibacter sp. JL216-2]|uniref:histidinol-phosphate transaminase n=1 Tax=Fusibacter sp. JL216-2 TaxID=3071453 RepID=UPI003D34B2AF